MGAIVGPDTRLHCEYHLLDFTQVLPAAQQVGPDQPEPPHCSHKEEQSVGGVGKGVEDFNGAVVGVNVGVDIGAIVCALVGGLGVGVDIGAIVGTLVKGLDVGVVIGATVGNWLLPGKTSGSANRTGPSMLLRIRYRMPCPESQRLLLRNCLTPPASK